MSSKAWRLQLRVDPEQKALLEANVLADRSLFVLDERAWQIFEQALSQTAADVPSLRELLSAPTVLD